MEEIDWKKFLTHVSELWLFLMLQPHKQRKGSVHSTELPYIGVLCPPKHDSKIKIGLLRFNFEICPV